MSNFAKFSRSLLLAAMQKYNPDQPRVPAGEPGAGQWEGNNTDDSKRDAEYESAKKFIYRWMMRTGAGAGNGGTDIVMLAMIGGRRSHAVRLAKYMVGMAEWSRKLDKFRDAHPGIDLSKLTADDLINNDLRPPRPPEWARSAFGPLADDHESLNPLYQGMPNAKVGWDGMVNLVKQAIKLNDNLTQSDMESIVANWMIDRYKITNGPKTTPPKK